MPASAREHGRMCRWERSLRGSTLVIQNSREPEIPPRGPVGQWRSKGRRDTSVHQELREKRHSGHIMISRRSGTSCYRELRPHW